MEGETQTLRHSFVAVSEPLFRKRQDEASGGDERIPEWGTVLAVSTERGPEPRDPVSSPGPASPGPSGPGPVAQPRRLTIPTEDYLSGLR